MVANVNDAVFDGSADDREADERREELGEERDDVDREHEGSMFRDEGRFASGLLALERRDFAAAEAAFSAFLEQGPLESAERAFLLNKRGVARIGLEQQDGARADFTAALEARPAFAAALTNLGNLLLEEGEVEAAIRRYENAIAADRDYALAYHNISVAYKRTGRIGEAVRALRHALRLEQRANAASSWRQARRR